MLDVDADNMRLPDQSRAGAVVTGRGRLELGIARSQAPTCDVAGGPEVGDIQVAGAVAGCANGAVVG